MSSARTPTTPAEARKIYHFAADPVGWHTQPQCVCGDYICQHEDEPPHRCTLRVQGGPGIACHCNAYHAKEKT